MTFRRCLLAPSIVVSILNMVEHSSHVCPATNVMTLRRNTSSCSAAARTRYQYLSSLSSTIAELYLWPHQLKQAMCSNKWVNGKHSMNCRYRKVTSSIGRVILDYCCWQYGVNFCQFAAWLQTIVSYY